MRLSPTTLNVLLSFGTILLAGSAGADEIVLQGESRLSGTVSAITEEGGVQLDSPLSKQPLALRAGVVKRVQFEESTDAGPPGGTRLRLSDGDVLPCELRTLDDATLDVSTAFAGDLKVPRTAVASLELGIHGEKVFYAGPESLDGWTHDKWKFEDDVLVCNGEGQLSRDFTLPDKFILRFRLAWRGAPNFQVSFADPLLKSGEPTDRYFMQFNTAGLEIKRQSSTGNNYSSLLQVNRTPDTFPKPQLDVEIRVDRTGSLMQLYLNGVQEAGNFPDPSSKTRPRGGGLVFSCLRGTNTEYRLSNIKVSAWDADGDRHRTEDRGDLDSDALITAEGGRYGGHLESIRPAAAGGPMLSFKSPLLETAMTIPAPKVSTVFFKVPKSPAGNARPYVLKLQGGGSLRLDSCTFSGTRIEAKHALLGPLSIKRSAVISIESTATPPKE